MAIEGSSTIVIGFVALAVLYPIICLTGATPKGMNLEQWVLEGYYIFFTLFMLASLLKIKLIVYHCGFLRHKFWQSLFYLL